MEDLDYSEQCNEQKQHDDEALALLKFIAIGMKTIAENPQSFENVKVFVSEL
ncbi:hypothetical protein [Celerinatantimonas sp. MCCC 1A17872]|uniref:hypothetical protein n=1 Tax=Celerinatantimonas sp. MCCC 1A17872 TaxID=3177514 RepID=UPI0038C78183